MGLPIWFHFGTLRTQYKRYGCEKQQPTQPAFVYMLKFTLMMGRCLVAQGQGATHPQSKQSWAVPGVCQS